MSKYYIVLFGIVVFVALYFLNWKYQWMKNFNTLVFNDYKTTIYSQKIQLGIGETQDFTFDIDVDVDGSYRFVIQLIYTESTKDYAELANRRKIQNILANLTIVDERGESLIKNNIESFDLIYSNAQVYSYNIASAPLKEGTYSVFLSLNKKSEFSDNLKGIFITVDRRPKA